jgi:hypothetical protein
MVDLLLITAAVVLYLAYLDLLGVAKEPKR